LRVEDVNLDDDTITFWHEKVSTEQTHKMGNGLLDAMQSYMARDALSSGLLLRGSRKDGALTSEGMNRFSIAQRIAVLDESAGVEGLSPHDLRPTRATKLAEKKTPLDRFMSAGGWRSPAIPLRYVEASKIANEGASVDDD
jgi:integrase